MARHTSIPGAYSVSVSSKVRHVNGERAEWIRRINLLVSGTPGRVHAGAFFLATRHVDLDAAPRC